MLKKVMKTESKGGLFGVKYQTFESLIEDQLILSFSLLAELISFINQKSMLVCERWFCIVLKEDLWEMRSEVESGLKVNLPYLF